MPTCAVCMSTIQNGEKYGIQDVFVVHRRCFGQTPKLRRDLQIANDKIAELRSDMQKAGADLRGINADLRRVRDQAVERNNELLRNMETVTDLREALVRAERELASERSQRALVELELRTTRAPVTPAPVETTEPISSEPEDITKARFSLLELD